MRRMSNVAFVTTVTILVTVTQNRELTTLNVHTIFPTHIRTYHIPFLDMLHGYSRLEEALNVQHFTVNHSREFVNPDDGTHTNTIEGTWNGIKLRVAPRNRTRENMGEHLLEFIWRRKHSEDLWNSFISALGEIYIE